MKNLFTFFLCVLGVYANAQQTISDWKYQKDFSSNPQNFVRAGKKIYFVATTPEHGRELWVTEGTTESTKLVKDIMVGENSGFEGLGNYAALEDGTFYFVALDNPNEKPKIWVTDGTEKGTKIYQNEVKGTLFHTGDELVEYKIEDNKGKIVIYHQDSKRDSILTIGQSVSSGYYQSSRNDNLLTVSLQGSIYGPFYLAIIDLKEQKVKVKSPSLYFQSAYQNITPWKNDVYMTFGNLILRMNTTTGKFDTLSIEPSKPIINQISIYGFFKTSKEFFCIFDNDVYTLQSNKFVFKNKAEFYKGIFTDNRTSNFYDSKKEVIYNLRYDYENKKIDIKGIKLSDGTVVKNFSIGYTTNINGISFVGTTSLKVLLESITGPFSLIDIETEKIKEFPYFISYKSIFSYDDKIIFGGNSTKDVLDSELYLLDSQTDEIKLLKNINTTGISTPKIFTTIFNGKMVQVYNNEQGVMLGVSDGTKSGTKDLQLLVKNYSISDLRGVIFQSLNQRLGILITTQNAAYDSNDSTFLYAINSKIDDIKLIVKNKSSWNMSSNTFGGEIKQVNPNLIYVKIYPYSWFTTDLTVENTKFDIAKISQTTIFTTDKFSIVYGTEPGKYLYQDKKYLARYDLKTQKIDTITKSDSYQIRYYVIDDKLYFESNEEKKCYVTDGNAVTELLGIEKIDNIIKLKGKTIISESLLSEVTTQYPTYYIKVCTSTFNFWQVDGTNTKKIHSFNNVNDKENVIIKETKQWEINGKTFLIFNLGYKNSYISNDIKIRFYEIKDDLRFTETYQMMKSDGYYGSGTSYIFEFNTFNSYDFLSNGLLFRQVEGNNQVFYIMKEDFIPREVYRINWKNKIRSNSLQSSQKKNYYFVTNGSVFVSDGSVSGSNLLLENNITSDAYFDFFSNYKIETNPDKFFFSFFPEKDFGVNLWITDGTKSGTVQLINQKSPVNYGGFGWGYMYNELLGNLGNKYIFKKPNADGTIYEVWTTEGTTATTTKLKDADGSVLSHPLSAPSILTSWYNLPKINNKLYFSRQTEKNGYEPWQTDGTPEGTKIVGDLVKGIQSSNPYQFVEINQNPYCIATEENKSLQLWAFCSNNLKPMIDVEKLSNLNVESVKLLASQNNDWKYQWIKDGKNVENATSPTLTTQNSGTYQIKIEDKVGCAFISDSVVVKILQKVLANEPLTEDFSLNIYPNPSQDDLNVSFETTNKGDFEATLYDLYGKVVSQQSVSPNTNNAISTKNLNAGTYIFRLSNGEKQSIRKVIKR